MTSTLLPILPAVDDVLFNFAQSDGLSQVNQVNSARNEGLTAPELNTVVGVGCVSRLPIPSKKQN